MQSLFSSLWLTKDNYLEMLPSVNLSHCLLRWSSLFVISISSFSIPIFAVFCHYFFLSPPLSHFSLLHSLRLSITFSSRFPFRRFYDSRKFPSFAPYSFLLYARLIPFHGFKHLSIDLVTLISLQIVAGAETDRLSIEWYREEREWSRQEIQ